MQSVFLGGCQWTQYYRLRQTKLTCRLQPCRKRIIKIRCDGTQQQSEKEESLISKNGHKGLISTDGWQSDGEDSSWDAPTNSSLKTTIKQFQWRLAAGLFMLVSIFVVFITQFQGKQKVQQLPAFVLPQQGREAKVSYEAQQDVGGSAMSEADSAILEKRVDASELQALSQDTGVQSLMQRTALAVRASASAAQAAQRAAAYASSAQTAASKAAEASEVGCLAALKAQQALENGIEKEIASAQAKAEMAEQMARHAEEKAAELSALATAYQDSSESQALVAQEAAKEEEKIVQQQTQTLGLRERLSTWYEDVSARTINLSNSIVSSIMRFFSSVWLYIESGYSWLASLFKSVIDWIQSLFGQGGAPTVSNGGGVTTT